jgi:hypothetical protein
VDFDACGHKPPGGHIGIAVDADHGDAAARQREGGGLARPREPDDECATRELHGFAAVR